MCPRIDPCVLSHHRSGKAGFTKGHLAFSTLSTSDHCASASNGKLVHARHRTRIKQKLTTNVIKYLGVPRLSTCASPYIYIVWYNYIYIIYWLYIVHHSSTMSEADKKKTAKIRTGWWYTYPSEKYEFVSWGCYSQYMEIHKIPWFQSPPTSKDKKLSQSWGFNSGRCHSKSPKRPYEKPPWGPSQRTYEIHGLLQAQWIGLRENRQETMVFTCFYHQI